MQVLFCSTENGRSSFVRQLEPDWHIDSNPEIVSQLAVCCYIHLNFIPQVKFRLTYVTIIIVVEATVSQCLILSSNY